MLSKSNLILAAPPGEARKAQTFGLPVAHMAYRVGGGAHLFRSSTPVPLRGGMMVIDDTGFSGVGETAPFCQEVLRECSARGFEGIICDFERRCPPLSDAVHTLAEQFSRRGWPMFVTESYAACSDKTRVLISSALSGGSLRQRLLDAVNQYGPGRVALSVERVAEDFFLPSPSGQGTPLSREALLERIQQRSPSVFFSDELCARYFTYMSKQNGAHFVLFDDALSIRKKLHIARSLNISDAVLIYPQLDDLLQDILT